MDYCSDYPMATPGTPSKRKNNDVLVSRGRTLHHPIRDYYNGLLLRSLLLMLLLLPGSCCRSRSLRGN